MSAAIMVLAFLVSLGGVTVKGGTWKDVAAYAIPHYFAIVALVAIAAWLAAQS